MTIMYRKLLCGARYHA